MSLTFLQMQQNFQQLMATQSRLIGADIEAIKREHGQLRLICYELMSHIDAITKAAVKAGIYTPPEPIVSAENASQSELIAK